MRKSVNKITKERIKEHLQESLMDFFIVVTLIDVMIFVMGIIFMPEQRFGYEVFIYPIIYGVLTSIPGLLFIETKEPTRGEYLLRQLFGFILVSLIVLTFMYGGNPFRAEYIFLKAATVLGVFIVYVLVMFFNWVLESRTARAMTNDLKRFQEIHEESEKTGD